MTPEEEAFKSLFAYTQLIMNGVTTAMPITSTYYKRWADTYEEEEAAYTTQGSLGFVFIPLQVTSVDLMLSSPTVDDGSFPGR